MSYHKERRTKIGLDTEIYGNICCESEGHNCWVSKADVLLDCKVHKQQVEVCNCGSWETRNNYLEGFQDVGKMKWSSDLDQYGEEQNQEQNGSELCLVMWKI